MSCISAHDPQLERLASAIAQRVGQQRFHVWFNNSTRLNLKQEGLEIAVPNDFISEWIGTHFARPIQEAAHEVLGCSLAVRFSVMPQLFEVDADDNARPGAPLHDAPAACIARHVSGNQFQGDVTSATAAIDQQRRQGSNGLAKANYLTGVHANAAHRNSTIAPAGINGAGNGGLTSGLMALPAAGASRRPASTPGMIAASRHAAGSAADAGGAAVATMPPRRPATTIVSERDSSLHRPRLRHDIESFVVGPSNQLAYNTAVYVSEFPGAQYNPLFIHGGCGLGKTHLLQGLCKRFIHHHPTKRWSYLTGEEFTNDFLTALRANKVDSFRRRMRELDLLVIDDVHFLGGKKATQEEFLHTFNAIEATGKQVVMASDNHPKMIEEFGESLINRFVSGLVVRIDPPNFNTRCEILRSLSLKSGLILPDEVTQWIARRVTQNVRELEGAVTRIGAHVKMADRNPDVAMAQQALGDLDRQMITPVRPDNVLQSVCNYFGLEHKDLMSGRRQRTISLARSVAMYLVRKTAKLSFPEIGARMGKRNHSTVISACRRIERAVQSNEPLVWTSAVGEREEEAAELLQRLEEQSRAMG